VILVGLAGVAVDVPQRLLVLLVELLESEDVGLEVGLPLRCGAGEASLPGGTVGAFHGVNLVVADVDDATTGRDIPPAGETNST